MVSSPFQRNAADDSNGWSAQTYISKFYNTAKLQTIMGAIKRDSCKPTCNRPASGLWVAVPSLEEGCIQTATGSQCRYTVMLLSP